MYVCVAVAVTVNGDFDLLLALIYYDKYKSPLGLVFRLVFSKCSLSPVVVCMYVGGGCGGCRLFLHFVAVVILSPCIYAMCHDVK